MRINHNIAALNTYRQLSANGAQTSKSLEKLSSGLRINRAGDDAAGLAISEKMRGQIRGLDQAARNGQDAISLIQTAEGALAETQSILQRMRELAVQASSDTNVSADRDEIQKEITQLSSEMNRIASSTEFNTMKLLNGDRDIETHVTTTNIAAVLKTIAKTGDNATNSSNGVTAGTSAPTEITNSADTDGIIITDAASDAFKWSNLDTSVQSQIKIEKTATGDIKVTMNGQDMDGNVLTVSNGKATVDVDGNYSYNAHGVDFKISAADYAAMTAANGSITMDMDARASALSAGSVVDQTLTPSLAVGVTYSDAANAPVIESLTGTSNTITLDNTDSEFDWSAVDDGTNDDSSIVITKLADGEKGFSVEITHVDSTNATDVSTASDLFGTLDSATGYYKFENHGVGFQISVEELNKMATGDTVTIDVDAIAAAAGGTDATGDIGTATNYTTPPVDSNGDAAVQNIMGAITITAADISAKAASVKVDFEKLSAGDATSKVTVTISDADGNALITDAIDVWDNIAADGDDWTYNSHGVSFTMTQAVDGDGHFVDDGSIEFELERAGSDGTGTVTTTNDWTSNVSITGGVSDAALDEITVDSDTIDQNIRKVVVTGSDLQTGGSAKIIVDLQDEDGVTVTKDEFTFADIADGKAFTYNNYGVSFDLAHSDAVSFVLDKELTTEEQVVTAASTTSTTTITDDSLNFQVGANQDQSMNLSIGDMRSKALSVTNSATNAGGTDVTLSDGSTVKAYFADTKSVTDGTTSTLAEYALDVTSSTKAGAAVTVIGDAISKVSAERSKLGALQNRLEHTINNLGTSSENLTAAESRIRDVDMAKEMMEFTKNNILSQAAQAMLAQANQQPQGVLQLLR